jgi:ABC-type molybdate transport system permease subunit
LEIFETVQLGHDASAYRLLIVSVIIAFGAVWLSEALTKRSAPQ